MSTLHKRIKPAIRKFIHFMTRLYNAVSPVTLNLEQSEGRQLLFNSGYDLRQSTYYAPDGTKLTDKPEIRSLFTQAIGEYNLELKLNKLAKDPKIIASLQEMYTDIKSGRRGEFDTKDYYHNRIIGREFYLARNQAWAKISKLPQVRRVILEQRQQEIARLNKRSDTANILNIYK